MDISNSLTLNDICQSNQILLAGLSHKCYDNEVSERLIGIVIKLIIS